VSGERVLQERITFYFNGVRRSISFEEASMLSDWLHKTRINAAQSLAQRLEAEMTTNADDRTGVELDTAERGVLRDLLTDVDLDEHAGLKGLAVVLRGEILNEPLNGESPAAP
jgi:hypothetical protein